jgi:crossover junction endodeoxyribonuclease RuvC
MPRSRTRSWRAFDPAAYAAGQTTTVAKAAVVAVAPVRIVRAASVRILGLDPGSRKTGFGVIECRGSRNTQVTNGCLSVGNGSLNERLRAIFDGVQELIEKFQPDEVAIEKVFLNRNVDSALKLGHARGAALCAVPGKTPVFEYAPRAIKLAVVGFGGAEKQQVAHMIRSMLAVEGKLSSDASDALAVAMCHAHSRHLHLLGVK